MINAHRPFRRFPSWFYGTVLALQFLSAQAFNGYTFFGVSNSRNAYLVNMSNTVVKTWNFSRTGGYSAYLLPDGTVLRTAMASSGGLNGGGAQGVVQRVDGNNTLVWEYTYSTSSVRAHHDIEPMPNGNVLIIAWEAKTAAQAVAAGLNKSLALWPEHIIEVQPVGTTGGNIVWQWHAWDHLVQQYDASKANYGVVKDHPELININLATNTDWMHFNGISYNARLDQIVVSSHNLNEVYVIDHSTTTAEAAGHTGGRYGKGGDILYRWGMPSNHGAPGTQVFKVVHCAIWIPDSLPGGGHIMAFNNREGQGTSMVVELNPPQDSAGFYSYAAGAAFGPATPYWSYTAADFYSNHLGGLQRLPNGNTLAVESTTGFLREVDPAGKDVWTYNRGGEVVRALRYAPEYPGLKNIIAGVDDDALVPASVSLEQNFPNPFNPVTTIQYSVPKESDVTLAVFDALGRHVSDIVRRPQKAGTYTESFDASALPSGVYFYRLTAGSVVLTKRMTLIK
ncbi:MAG: aryl-sulfate sulfotransferase [Bacteroidetes bacterium]|nr:aryl-sulfate sulfotransferase [Bacteroidota bacterium]